MKAPTRRAALAGAAATALVAVPSAQPLTKPEWLIVAEPDLAADPWLDFNLFGPNMSLTVLPAETDYQQMASSRCDMIGSV